MKKLNKAQIDKIKAKRKSNPWTKEELEYLKELYDIGLCASEISRAGVFDKRTTASIHAAMLRIKK